MLPILLVLSIALDSAVHTVRRADGARATRYVCGPAVLASGRVVTAADAHFLSGQTSFVVSRMGVDGGVHAGEIQCKTGAGGRDVCRETIGLTGRIVAECCRVCVR